MIDLTHEQRQELGGERPTIRDPETGTTYVLVKAEVYDRLHRLLGDDEDDLTPSQVAILVDEAMREYDEGDPTLEFYQREYGRKP